MRKIHLRLVALLCAATLPGMASAFTIYDDFGAFPDATWGGTGIPNDAVAASKQFINGDNTIRIALSATERFSNPPVADNGAAIYTAGAGSNFGGANESTTEGALWNFNFFIDIVNSNGDPVSLADYQIDLYYDLEAGPARALGDLSGLGRLDITSGAAGLTEVQNSQNLMFGYLAGSPLFPGVFPPGGSFDPTATGNYQFAITVSALGSSFPIESVAMEVEVVPVPAAVWLFGSALGLLAWVRRRTA